MYKVNSPVKERWIHILFHERDSEEHDSFVRLLKAYRNKLSGKIVPISEEMQYKIDNDDSGLIFQWDSCFGISVVVPDRTDLTKAYNTLVELCESLNHIISQETVIDSQEDCDEE
ncbi:MAG: hypothetical protein IJY74_02655 [Oscillospiraceae bacterium]|nr:hypothetical protein [Oscillospiraceae bacterium]